MAYGWHSVLLTSYQMTKLLCSLPGFISFNGFLYSFIYHLFFISLSWGLKRHHWVLITTKSMFLALKDSHNFSPPYLFKKSFYLSQTRLKINFPECTLNIQIRIPSPFLFYNSPTTQIHLIVKTQYYCYLYYGRHLLGTFYVADTILSTLHDYLT